MNISVKDYAARDGSRRSDLDTHKSPYMIELIRNTVDKSGVHI
jgi:hypothetical protein